jgi:hypothetical protein
MALDKATDQLARSSCDPWSCKMMRAHKKNFLLRSARSACSILARGLLLQLSEYASCRYLSVSQARQYGVCLEPCTTSWAIPAIASLIDSQQDDRES